MFNKKNKIWFLLKSAPIKIGKARKMKIVIISRKKNILVRKKTLIRTKWIKFPGTLPLSISVIKIKLMKNYQIFRLILEKIAKFWRTFPTKTRYFVPSKKIHLIII